MNRTSILFAATASNEETVYLYGLPFRRDTEFLARSGTGVSLWGGGEYQHPINSQWREISP